MSNQIAAIELADSKGLEMPAMAATAAVRVKRHPVCQAAIGQLAELEPWTMEQQIALTSVAAPTGFEGLRAEWMLRRWQELGLEAEIDAAGNVIAERPGVEAEGPLLAFTAHLDTAFAPGTVVRPERRRGRVFAPGIADNGAGLAALLTLIRVLQEGRIETQLPILFVANVGEEGEGDLKGMRHLFRPGSALAQRIGRTVVLDGPGCDQITDEGLPSRRVKLIFQGPGGHSWSDLGRASAVHAASRTAVALLAQVQPQSGVQGCNLGCIQGGSAVNAIAAEAQIKIDLRAQTTETLERLGQAVGRALALGVEQENAAALEGTVRGRAVQIGERPGGKLDRHSPLLRLVREVDAVVGIRAQLQAASTDANVPLAQGREALRLGAGGICGGIHTLQEWYDPAGRGLALERLLLVLLASAGLKRPKAGGRRRPLRLVLNP